MPHAGLGKRAATLGKFILVRLGKTSRNALYFLYISVVGGDVGDAGDSEGGHEVHHDHAWA